MEISSQVLNQTPEIMFRDLCAPKWIDTVSGLSSLCRLLENSTEFAVDLEHHDYRTFQGFTCLIQISVREEDFIIDPLELRSDLHLLNQSFTDPRIVKVLHGAESDIQWLQRDFGVYIVGLFDTYHASHLLELSGHGYAFLLQHYCGVQTDKRFQMSDWRIRPLTEQMITYAQMDTHYLLYIYDRMRNELLEASNPDTKNLIYAQMERSAQTSLRVYEKDIYDVENGMNSNGWAIALKKSKDILNDMNFSVFRALHHWRDITARKEDESLRIVMPMWVLFILARVMPTTIRDLIDCSRPVPNLIRSNAAEIIEIIRNSVNDFKFNAELRLEESKRYDTVMKQEWPEQKKIKPVHFIFEEVDQVIENAPITLKSFQNQEIRPASTEIITPVAVKSKMFAETHPKRFPECPILREIKNLIVMEAAYMADFSIDQMIKSEEDATRVEAIIVPEDNTVPVVIVNPIPVETKRKREEVSDIIIPLNGETPEHISKKSKKKMRKSMQEFSPFDYSAVEEPTLKSHGSSRKAVVDFNPHGLLASHQVHIT